MPRALENIKANAVLPCRRHRGRLSQIVILAKAGIWIDILLDPGLRRDDSPGLTPNTLPRTRPPIFYPPGIQPIVHRQAHGG